VHVYRRRVFTKLQDPSDTSGERKAKIKSAALSSVVKQRALSINKVPKVSALTT